MTKELCVWSKDLGSDVKSVMAVIPIGDDTSGGGDEWTAFLLKKVHHLDLKRKLKWHHHTLWIHYVVAPELFDHQVLCVGLGVVVVAQESGFRIDGWLFYAELCALCWALCWDLELYWVVLRVLKVGFEGGKVCDFCIPEDVSSPVLLKPSPWDDLVSVVEES